MPTGTLTLILHQITQIRNKLDSPVSTEERPATLIQHALERIEARLDKPEANISAPPPTAEAFVFTAPGTLREIVSQQNTVMKDLADQVARQSITLKEMQAKMDAQEQAQNENNEKKRGQIIRLWEEQKELQAKMDAQELAQDEKIATLSAEVALQKTNVIRFQDQIGFLAGKIYSIHDVWFAHFQKVVDNLADRVFICEPTPPRGADWYRPKVVKVNTKMKKTGNRSLDTDPGLCPALIHCKLGEAEGYSLWR